MAGMVYRIDVKPGMAINYRKLTERYGLRLISVMESPGGGSSLARFYSPDGHDRKIDFKKYVRKNPFFSGLDTNPGGDVIWETEGKDYVIVNEGGECFMDFTNSAKARVAVNFARPAPCSESL